MKKRMTFSVVLILLPLLLAGCLAPQGTSPEEKRRIINETRSETLDLLYQQRPTARDILSKAAGDAVFSNINAQYIFIGGGGGYGVAVDHATGQKTYMRMAQVGVGLGLGVQDIRVVFVFHSQRAFDDFIIHGWEFGAQADAAAKARNKGGAATGEVSIDSEISVYTLTEAGLMAKANLAGTKYWQYQELN